MQQAGQSFQENDESRKVKGAIKDHVEKVDKKHKKKDKKDKKSRKRDDDEDEAPV